MSEDFLEFDAQVEASRNRWQREQLLASAADVAAIVRESLDEMDIDDLARIAHAYRANDTLGVGVAFRRVIDRRLNELMTERLK